MRDGQDGKRMDRDDCTYVVGRGGKKTFFCTIYMFKTFKT